MNSLSCLFRSSNIRKDLMRLINIQGLAPLMSMWDPNYLTEVTLSGLWNLKIESIYGQSFILLNYYKIS